MFNAYFMEMTARWKQDEMNRCIEERRVRAILPARPPALRRALSSAVVRFGMFLEGGAYHCPDAVSQH